MVCREGCVYKPDEVLGIYVYAKRVPRAHQPSDRTGTNRELYCTVTHYNPIHFTCHRAAAIADRDLRVGFIASFQTLLNTTPKGKKGE